MKITDKLKMRIWISTQICYCKALKDTYPDIFKDIKETSFKLLGTDREMRSELKDAGLEERNEDIHRRYMGHVLNLSTKELELIIEADKQEVIRRAPYTIDEITYELLNRVINPETKEPHESKTNKQAVSKSKPVLRSVKRASDPKRTN